MHRVERGHVHGLGSVPYRGHMQHCDWGVLESAEGGRRHVQ
jgi:hypothetical protein